jgi:predicted RNase H-like HicB family nuclease
MDRAMKMFPAIVHHDEGSAWGLTFPDLPGCFAASDDADGIVAAGAEALSLWFEDQPEVQPTPFEKIATPPGTTLLLVPWIKPMRKVMKVNLSMQTHVVRAIDAAAKARGLTRSAFLAEAALAEIEGRH